MNDMIITGTGNSRYLKSVSDFKARYPTYEAFAAALIEGTLPIDLNGINLQGVQQEGTLLNKANLLSDQTAAALGLGENDNPTVDQALALIGTLQTNLLSKTEIVTGYYTGNNAASRTISLGFKPKAVLLTNSNGSIHEHQYGGDYDNITCYGGLALDGFPTRLPSTSSFPTTNLVKLTDSGFEVYYSAESASIYRRYVYTNKSNTVFYYISIK